MAINLAPRGTAGAAIIPFPLPILIQRRNY